MKFKQYITGLNEDDASDHKARVAFADEAIKKLDGELRGYLDHYAAVTLDNSAYAYAPTDFKTPFKVSGQVVTFEKNGTPKPGERLQTSEIVKVFKKDKFSAIKTKSGGVYVLITRVNLYQDWLDSVSKYSI